MFAKKMLVLSIGIIVIMTVSLLAVPVQAQARIPLQASDGSKCVTCHEDLYYLHDTGKAYCLKDSPMACVNCHGGDPAVLTKEAAHFDLTAHPVINDNDRKCDECHPAEAETRLAKFRQMAGISEVKVAIPYVPAVLPVTVPAEKHQPEKWVPGLETVSLIIIAGLALVIFFVAKIRHG